MMKNYLLFSFLKYKNRSSSSSIATNKKKKKGSNFFLSKTSPFFLRSCVISTNPFLPFASSSDDQSPSSIAARALRGMFLSDSDPLFELTFRVRITFVCVYMLSRLQLIKYLFCHRSSVCFFPSVTFSCDLTSCLIVIMSVIQTQIFLLS